VTLGARPVPLSRIDTKERSKKPVSPAVIPERRLTFQEYHRICDDPAYRRGEWRDDASCVALMKAYPAVYTVETWFPVNPPGSRQPTRVPEDVKRICGECTVRLECLTYAIGIEPIDGIWAGHLPKAIRRYIRKLKGRSREATDETS